MWIKSRNKALDKKRRKGQLPAWSSGLGFHQQNLMLGAQSPKHSPAAPGWSATAGQEWDPKWEARERNLSDKANLSHSQAQNRLFMISSMRVRGQQPCSEENSRREAAWECRCCCRRPLCWPSPTASHWVPLQHTLCIGTKVWYFSVLEGKCRAETSKCCSRVLSGAAVSLPVLQTAV